MHVTIGFNSPSVWSYGLLGALHFVTLWWLRDQATAIDLVIDQITSLLWSGVDLEVATRPSKRKLTPFLRRPEIARSRIRHRRDRRTDRLDLGQAIHGGDEARIVTNGIQQR